MPTSLYLDTLAKKIPHCNDFEYLGRVDPGYHKDHKVVRTIICPLLKSVLKEYYPDLCDGEYLRTKYNLTAKYSLAEYTSMSRFKNPYIKPHDIPWNNAKHMVSEAFSCIKDCGVLDLDDSIKWLNRPTSPGYPWTLVYQTKAPIIDSEWWRSWYFEWEQSVISRVANRWFWKSFIKDELKKKTDIDEHNPRTITGSPIQGSLLGCRLYSDFNDKMTRAGCNFQIPCWVGVSKYNRQWHRLAMRLARFECKFHGDCHRFDGTCQPCSFDLPKDLRRCSSNFSKEEEIMHEYYYDNVVNSVIVGSLGDLFSKFMGQPSGQNNTLHDNSIIHLSYWFYHWCYYVCPRLLSVKPTWFSFREHVELIVMGDDVVWSCSKHVLNFMLPSLVAKTFSTICVTLKFDSDRPSEWEELEFCSMTFRDLRGLYVPIMKPEKMIASIFLKSGKNPRMVLRRLYALRIEVYWDKYILLMVDRCIDHIKRTYMTDLRLKPTGVEGDDLSYDQIETLYWSSYTIEQHYLWPRI